MKKLFTLIVIFIGFVILKAQPVAPVATAATNVSYVHFNANWNGVAGATSYRLDVSDASDFSNMLFYNNATENGNTSATINMGISTNHVYYYRVRAVGTSGTSANSNIISVTTLANPPIANNPQNVTKTSFIALWSAQTNESRLDIATDVNFTNYVSGYQDKQIINNYYCTVTGLSSGTTYYYRIRSVNSAGITINSNVITVTTVLDAPVATAATDVGYGPFTAHWNSVAGATSYRIDVSTSSDFSSTTYYTNYTVNGTSVIIGTAVGLNTMYYYRVRAVGVSGTSANSNVITTMTLASPPDAHAATNITPNSFQANWTIGSNVGGGGRLDVATDLNFINFLPGYQDKQTYGYTSANISGLSSGTTYYYRLRSVNALGYASGNSGVITVTTLPDAPVATAATSIIPNSFIANWSTVVGASSYRLDVALTSDFSNMTYYNNYYVDSNSNSVTGTSPNTTYYYRVRAVDASGVSVNSNIIQVTTLSCPSLSTPTSLSYSNITQTSANLSWASVSGATGYLLTFNVNYSDGTHTSFTQTSSTHSYSLTNLEPSTTYQVQVMATYGTCTSANSSILSFATSAMATPTITYWDGSGGGGTGETTSYTLYVDWNSVVGAHSYDVLINNGSNGSANTTSLTYSWDGDCDVDYVFKVRAKSLHGSVSGYSNVTANLPCPPDGRVMATGTDKSDSKQQLQISPEVRDITAYPNPTSDIVTVAVPWVADEETPIMFMDILGKELSSFVLKKGTWKSEISTKKFSDGIYFIKVAGNKSSVRVVVKH